MYATPTLATRFANTTRVLRSEVPLSEDQMRQAVPSIFAQGKHASRSERYTYIPTIDVLRGLKREGFEPFMVAQGRSRIEGKAEYTKHLIRMRHRRESGTVATKPEAHEIILINSHDGASSNQLMAGTKYSGVAPVTERSGNKCWIHWRWQCPTFLRQTFVEWAAQTINKSFWAGAFYRQQRDKGSSHQAAVRALAFKWLRILYRCWQTRTPYDESTYLNALKKRGSPLLNQLNTQT